jgi:hypothetical protein
MPMLIPGASNQANYRTSRMSVGLEIEIRRKSSLCSVALEMNAGIGRQASCRKNRSLTQAGIGWAHPASLDSGLFLSSMVG